MRFGSIFPTTKFERPPTFQSNTKEAKQNFLSFLPAVVRNFREYAIPTIEITLDDDTSLDEIINLFVDINQHGVKVNRFDIVKAIGKENKLLRSVLKLIATQQKRRQDVYFKKRVSAFTRVLSELSFIKNLEFSNQVVDRMWERLFEIVLFCRTKEHREPRQVLKRFITSKKGQEEEDYKEGSKSDGNDDKAITASEMNVLQRCFNFLSDCYRTSSLGNTMLATDQPHFYTMVTSLMVSDLLLPH